MSERTPVTKTQSQLRTEARERIEKKGRKAHPAKPGTVEARKQEVQRRIGVLDDEGRYPATATDSFESQRRKKIRSAVAKVVAAGALTVGGGLALGEIAPEPGDTPHPGNMESFNDDPLQEQYNLNPENHSLVSGQIANRTGSEVADDLFNVSQQHHNELTKSQTPPEQQN